MKKVHVYKSEDYPSRPWCADVVWPDGVIWRGWQQHWKRKAEMMQNIAAVAGHDWLLVEGRPK